MLNNFIGGGQVFLHKITMFAQVFFRTLHVSLFLGILLACFINWNPSQKIDWDGFLSYRKAIITISLDDSLESIREAMDRPPGSIILINAKSKGRILEDVDPYKILRMGKFQNADETNYIKIAKI